ncbi:MAG: ABC transporter permease [Hyphomicrobiales bacterium]|nr:ABC transporter permease [Hyphomicrobiales bacterium]
MLRLVPRREPSRALLYATPVMALGFTLVAGFVMFALLGKDPVRALGLIFVSPLTSLRGLSELTVKATPLILIAVGLSVGFRAGVWNIGAEGQFALGAISSGSVALWAWPGGGPLLLPAMCLAGIAGGMLWAAIPALLRTRFGTNEILVSLMLVYVAVLLLSLLVHGPLKDPQGFNFPESRLFQADAQMPLLVQGFRAHAGFVVALIVAAAAAVLMARHAIGFRVRVLGEAPRAARFAGISEGRMVWLCLLVSGGLAGLAGTFEAAGPVGQLVPALPAGYGFTAIIVAFLGRLDPAAIVVAGLLLALTYIGGEAAQIAMSLPSATTSVFQGMLLFFLLACDVLVGYRLVFGRAAA